MSTHEIFNKPRRVELAFDEIETPAHYRTFYNGRKLGPKMRTWRVQTVGYRGSDAIQAGVVAGGWGFADSPDAEFIASGLNTKGPKYVALGRHGPFFQWGFAAAPSQMTKSAKDAFVNSICYIAKFDRRAPLTRKRPRSLARGFALDRAMSLLRIEKNYRKLLENHKERAATRDRALAVQKSKSRPLTDRERSALRFPKVDPISWERYQQLFFGAYPAELVKRLGKSGPGLAAYLEYYEKNLEYLMRSGRGFVVDEDAKALGISNRDQAILAKAIDLLAGKHSARGKRLLERYTDQRHDNAAEWRAWFDREKSTLFFSDVDGFRFYSSRRKPAKARGQR